MKEIFMGDYGDESINVSEHSSGVHNAHTSRNLHPQMISMGYGKFGHSRS
jgi:hypothetical protein